MLVLRYAYVLALVVWLGGMVLLAAVVAPTTFGVLQAIAPEQGRALAGELFGTVLIRFHYLAYAAGTVLLLSLAAIAVLGPRPAHFAIRCGIVLAMLLVALYSGFVVLRDVETLRQQIGTVPSTLPAADPRRIRFDALHELSTRLMMLNMAAALVLLLWEARE